MQQVLQKYSLLEERLNVMSHFIGIVLSVVGLVFLLFKAIDNDSLTALVIYIVYCLSIIALFTASTLYHSEKNNIKRKRLKIFDHCAIYIMIAGSYIPFLVLGVGNKYAYILLMVVWALAIAGVVLKLFFTGRFQLLSTISYVLLGWVAIVAIKPLMEALSLSALLWLALGGIFYTLGAVLYQIKRIPFNHAIFHFFVLAGAYSHYHAVYWYL